METLGLRSLTPEVLRFLREEQKMAFVAGPRQVGKTTFAKRLLRESQTETLYFNWDIAEDRKLLVKHPGNFWQHREGIAAHPRPRIVLDEIHKFPRWKRFLKGLYDEHGRTTEMIVTGSGRLDVYQRGGDSLFGRYHLYHLHPFTLGELLAGDRNSTIPPNEFWTRLLSEEPTREAESLLKGLETLTGFPEPLFSGSEARLRRWRQAHRTVVLREDLRDLTRIRDIGIIETLALLLPERVGSPLSVNALREDLDVNFATVKGYLETLTRLFYLFTVKPYAARLARTLRIAEKVYLFDPTEIQHEGARFENVIALHLRKLVDTWGELGFGDFDLHYIRDREKREVDFLVTEAKKPYALIEAKLSSREIDPNLRYFSERLKPRYTVQVVRNTLDVPSVKNISGVLLVPAHALCGLI
jgi:predicted AAA+ superfamily ATPase